MRIDILRPPVALLLLALSALTAFGCGKADSFERNMQYVSDEILYHDAGRAWETINAARAQWVKAGASHDKDDPAFQTYKDAYRHYAVIYNEIMDRQKAPLSRHLRGETNELPPPPPAGGRSATPHPDATPVSEPDAASQPGPDAMATDPAREPLASILTESAGKAKPFVPRDVLAANGSRPTR